MAERSTYHNFHHHRLESSRSSEVYRESDGVWKCDACQRQFCDDMTTPITYKMASQPFYHCGRCNVDLCGKCFNGKWTHSLHDIPGHELKPVDPRIEYRIHDQWQCDMCSTRRSHADPLEVFFHCACNFDLCGSCFGGQKHYLHQHPVVSVDSRKCSPWLRCSNCNKLLTNQGPLFRCYDSQCSFQLCNTCFTMSPSIHPFHRHPLEVFDSYQAYPYTGGVWHCNNCTTKSPHRPPEALTSKNIMFHCPKCDYDLCEKCYCAGVFPSNH